MRNLRRFLFTAAAALVLSLAFTASQAASAQTATAGQLLITEFRYRGLNGANDEFIEIYNNSGADHTVFSNAAVSGATGYGIARSPGTLICSIPNGTVIPNRGHFLCVNSVGYSLATYPAGVGSTASGDQTYTTNIPENVGIALFNNDVAGNFTSGNRIDAVGTTAEASTTFREGTGLPTLVGFSIDYAWVRDFCGKGGSITTFGPCPTAGAPKDTDNNAADFYFVDTNGTSAGGGQRLGTPGPESLASPIRRNEVITASLIDPCVGAASPPNRIRSFTSDPANNSTFGTLDIRRTLTNNTGAAVTRMRFRVADLTTFPAPSGIADLRPITSTTLASVSVDAPVCGGSRTDITVLGTTLEQPPSQPNGGGFNSSMSVAIPGGSLANGASISVRFVLGLQQSGTFKFLLNVEALP
jgi:hypothetical protein